MSFKSTNYITLLLFLIIIEACSKKEEVFETKITSLSVSDITLFTAVFKGSISVIGSDGITDHGFVWSLTENPTLDNNPNKTSLGAINNPADFESKVEGLEANTEYFARIYTINNEGNASYGGSFKFATKDGWNQKQDFSAYATGKLIDGSTSFVIDGKAYVGGGRNLDDNVVLKQCWAYSPITDTWSQVANMIYERQGAVGFAIDGKGYVVTGSYARDVQQYDPTNNTWSKKADFPGEGRFYAAGFAINGKGYVGAGRINSNTQMYDFWEYSPSSDQWTQKALIGEDIFSGIVRSNALGFVINGKGYIGGGVDSNNERLSDFWEYDPSTGMWSKKADIPSIISLAGSFSLGNEGYLVQAASLYIYNPSNNAWKTRTNFKMTSTPSVGFAIDGKAYVAMPYSRERPVWQYNPN
ncbi:hypothetical protein BKI52_42800 [marine bacterium AO1-C]|nr:hypothetical protein BKI52_42800 [marine bacterium AO1-C]